MSKRSSALVSRVKKLMQEDEEVGKMSAGAPAALAHAVEVLVERLVKGASDIAIERSDKVLGPSHLKANILKDASMDFLREIVASAPELPEKKAAGPKRERKPRAKPSLSDERDADGQSPAEGKKRGRGRGRGRGAEGGRSTKESGGRGKGRKKKGDTEAEEPAEKKLKVEGAGDIAVKDESIKEDVKLETDTRDQSAGQDSSMNGNPENQLQPESDAQEEHQPVVMTEEQVNAMNALFQQHDEEDPDGNEDDENYD